MDNGTESYRRFLGGDENGFDEILDMYRDNLIFFINGFVHCPAVAEDIAADVFTYLLIHKHRYNFRVSLKTYLFMLGRSRALDRLRREKRAAAVEILPEDAADFSALEDRLIAEEQKRAVNAAIDRLNDGYRTVIHLIFFEEMTNSEAAKVMKKSNKQIENLVCRAKKALRAELEGEDL